jgi:hypothetical protein
MRTNKTVTISCEDKPKIKQKPFYEGKTKTKHPNVEALSGLPLVGYTRISLVDLVN